MRLLTAQQVADEFGIPSARTVRTMRNRGLPFVKLGKACLFDADDVEVFIRAQRQVCEPPRKNVRSPLPSRTTAAEALAHLERHMQRGKRKAPPFRAGPSDHHD